MSEKSIICSLKFFNQSGNCCRLCFYDVLSSLRLSRSCVKRARPAQCTCPPARPPARRPISLPGREWHLITVIILRCIQSPRVDLNSIGICRPSNRSRYYGMVPKISSALQLADSAAAAAARLCRWLNLPAPVMPAGHAETAAQIEFPGKFKI